MSNRVLVIGGAGYIGSHITLELLENNFQLVALDDLSNGSRRNILSGVEFIEGDYLDQNILSKALDKDIDAVILTAALKSVEQSMIQVEDYSSCNIIGVVNLLNAMVQRNIKYLLFASTAAVYGNPNYTPIDEKHQTKPANYYGYTKLAIEHLLPWYHSLKGLNYGILRYFNVVGYDKQLRCSGLEREYRNVLPIIMEAAFKKRAKFEIYGTDYNTADGSAVRDYIHVSDIADANVKAMKYLQSGAESFCCNLGSGNKISVKELVEQVKNITGRDFQVNNAGRRLGDPDIYYSDSSYAQKLLGWELRHSGLEDIITSTYAAFDKELEH